MNVLNSSKILLISSLSFNSNIDLSFSSSAISNGSIYVVWPLSEISWTTPGIDLFKEVLTGKTKCPFLIW